MRVVVDLPFVPTTCTAGRPACGWPSSASSASIRAVPNPSVGHGESPSSQARWPMVSTRRRARPQAASASAEELELAADTARASRAPPRRRPRARSRRSARSRASPRRERSPCGAAPAPPRCSRRPASALAGRPPRRSAAPRRSSSSTRTPLRRNTWAASCTRSRAPSASACAASGSGHADTIRRVSRAGEVRPDLLGHVRHQRDGGARASSSSAHEGRRPRVLVAVVEPRLDRLGVPVAEVVEREVVERARRRRRSRTRPRRPRPRAAGGVEPREDPALLERRRRERRASRRSACLEDQARDVPELVRELAPLLDRPSASSGRPASTTS